MIKKLIKNFSFRYKLTLSYFILVLLPIVIVGSFSYNVALETFKNHTRENIELTVKQIRDNIDYKLDAINSISEYLSNDLLFQKALSREYSHYGGVEFQDYLRSYMVPLVNLPVTRSRIFLYLHNTSIPEAYVVSQEKGQDPLRAGRGYDIQHIESVKGYDWFKSLGSLNTSVSWQQVDNDKEVNNISLLKKFYNLDGVLKYGAEKSQLGYIRIIVKLQELFDVERYEKPDSGRFFIVLDSKENIIYSNPATGSEQLAGLKDSGKYLEIESGIPEIDSKLMIFVPISQLEESARRVRKLSIIICSLSLVFFTLISFILSKHFSKRVSRIVNFINSFRDGEFNKRLKTSDSDELYQISSAMNEMAATINNLIEEIYVTNIRKANAELQVLQSQINPHFLYNTLASVSTLAQLGKVDKLNYMIEQLVSFYRLTLNKGSFIIPVEKELQQVKAYIDIKKTQYNERLNVYYDIDPDILQYKTIKIILQPFVENSLEHGMFMGRKLNIRIVACREDNNVIFKVIDDGLGMQPSLIDQILSIEENSIGYGVGNVNERIKLQFGAQYGVRIFSRPGIGTTIKIVIPLFEG